jgi:hypothetical protein
LVSTIVVVYGTTVVTGQVDADGVLVVIVTGHVVTPVTYDV